MSQTNPGNLSPPEYPPEPNDFDRAIAYLGGTTIALEATSKHMQASKTIPPFNIPAMLEYKTFQNSQLREQLAYEHKRDRETMVVFEGLEALMTDIQALIDEYHYEIEIHSNNSPYNNFI
jgi:nucleotidyltransferase/DNA polymerase involved in DNA repair